MRPLLALFIITPLIDAVRASPILLIQHTNAHTQPYDTPNAPKDHIPGTHPARAGLVIPAAATAIPASASASASAVPKSAGGRPRRLRRRLAVPFARAVADGRVVGRELCAGAAILCVATIITIIIR